MEGTSGGFRKELVGKLLQLHFKDDKTKVSGDALRLMAELLKIFVVGSVFPESPMFLSCQPRTGLGEVHPVLHPRTLSSCVTAEAAIRSVRQAQAEDLALVDVDQLEKVLPQLLLDF
ncbi:centromere protein X isoform X1 [Puma concolor]|uniref:Centromere protein X n=1 Tax=Puma concolor TaxID=9696 RepID=A0A6P6I5Q1_PUMCO|nr:centromere protein X isoform X1 [Puma concolor]